MYAHLRLTIKDYLTVEYPRRYQRSWGFYTLGRVKGLSLGLLHFTITTHEASRTQRFPRFVLHF